MQCRDQNPFLSTVHVQPEGAAWLRAAAVPGEPHLMVVALALPLARNLYLSYRFSGQGGKWLSRP